ncbi:hypothetical protein AXX12_03540 [Anaerosporomusa subterranea]|uniref:Uncharacterized protein n=1 Tax=Anaerosporomusa subterranea TaxID=1794912 RepID=A0A154BTG3_ANASB|nr:hypothetical protein [Anaerosporomusa subterranea]KYZ77219.1 hypothetical protein AXX12_03540 [Anaerosporomusa subterranea]
MKKIVVCVFLLLLIASQTLAMSPVNTFIIRDAQEYGRRLAFENYSSFMTPWTAFEEKAQRLSEFTEQAQIFTPYILVAANAREKALSNQPILLENSEKALAQYNGYLVFSITIHSQDPSAPVKLNAKLVQDKQTLTAYYISPPTYSQYNVNGKILASAQFYLYFVDKTLLRNRPVLLLLTDDTKHNRSFFFDLEKVL